MNLRRGGLLPLGILLALLVVVALGGAARSSATLTFVTAQDYFSQDCVPTSGRRYCVKLTTWNQVDPNGGVQVDVKVQNYDESTLTNPKLELRWAPRSELTVRNTDPALPPGCQKLTEAAGAYVACALPNINGNGSAANGTNHIDSALLSFFFDSAATGDITWAATALVNESGNGQGLPNTEVRTAVGTTEFGEAGDDQAATFGLPGNTPTLGTLATGSASFAFKFPVPPGTKPFKALFQADESDAFCLGGLSCFKLQLSTDLSEATPILGTSSSILLWHFIALDPSFNRNSARVIHSRDGVAASANLGANTITGVDFRGVDGVSISGSDFDGNYWVRNASESSFKISQAKNGPLFDIPGSGTVTITAGKMVIVGDSNTEKDEDCKKAVTDPTHAGAVTLPSLWVDSVDADNDTKTDDLEFWFCDNGNGNVGPWG